MCICVAAERFMAFVRIALDGAGSFVKLDLSTGDDVYDLAKRVSAEFPHWGTPDKLSLFLVAAGGQGHAPSLSSGHCAPPRPDWLVS